MNYALDELIERLESVSEDSPYLEGLCHEAAARLRLMRDERQDILDNMPRGAD